MTKNKKTFVFVVQPKSGDHTARVYRVMRVGSNAHEHLFVGLANLKSLDSSVDEVSGFLKAIGKVGSNEILGETFRIDKI